jgi:murein DD-endopeptidase MepM/ murein hydrolase activator NlpD
VGHGVRAGQWFVFVLVSAIGASGSLPEIGLPIDGLNAASVRDTFDEIHSGHPHEAIDLPAPKGTPVHAVVSGSIRKLFLSKSGGNAIYEFDDAGEYCYYYAHLDRYAEGLREGMRVGRGELIGFVGSTGNADSESPHLHFSIFELGPERLWWKGKAINPYRALLAATKRAK